MAKWCHTLIALASVVPCFGGNPHEPLGQYQPVSNVIELAQIALDVRGITDAAHHHDFTGAKHIYEEGSNSCINATSRRSLKSFVSSATASQHLQGGAYFDSFTNGAGPSGADAIPGPGRLPLQPDFWDEFISSALDGTGRFSNKSETSRMVAVKKGILGVITMYVSHLLETSIALAKENRTGDGDGALHVWDAAWALYYGACGEGCLEHCVTQGWCRFSAWEALKKRDGDHARNRTYQRVEGTILASSTVENYFLEGQRATRAATLDVPALIRVRNNIYRMFSVNAIRATLRYSYAMNRGNGLKYNSLNELLHMQAYTYFLAAAGWIEQSAPGSGQHVLQLLDFQQVTGEVPLSLHCDVKATLHRAYEPLGLDAAKIGQDWAIPETFQCNSLPVCPTAPDLPLGLPGYAAHDTETPAGAKLDCTSSSSIMPSTSSIMPSTSTTTTSSMDVQAHMCALEAIEIMGAGAGAVNGVYHKVPNRQNAEVGRTALTECELCATWQNGQWQVYVTNSHFWRISGTDPLSYYYDGVGHMMGPPRSGDWDYKTEMNGTKPDPVVLPARMFVPITGQEEACRGATSTDNSNSYYELVAASSLEECQDRCLSQPQHCKGFEFSRGRCEIWTRPEGILSSYKLTGFACLRNDLAPVFSPVDGGKDRACRGATSSDNSASYYKVFKGLTLRDCQSECMDEALCKGIEHSPEYGNNGRCEIWTLSHGIGSSAPVAGYTCMSYKARPLTPPLV
ncbi:unnamed protein product [Polarella glacialis]|uniref:Apple domain-containing protein n=1 Tax=Polarella glacialis TaxID=89957 RepID=A0A813FWC9_POLGL|nr:unnamed protein product [Polarella glacialis]